MGNIDFDKIIKTFIVIAILTMINSCQNYDKSNKSSTAVVFSEEVNRYNYLDKPHDLKYVYDFEGFFTENESLELYERLSEINKNLNVTFIVVSDGKGNNQDFRENTMITNNIFKSKHDLDKVVTLKFSKLYREIGIAYSENLASKINDSLCKSIIETTLSPNFKNEQFYIGVNSSIDSLVNYIEKK